MGFTSLGGGKVFLCCLCTSARFAVVDFDIDLSLSPPGVTVNPSTTAVSPDHRAPASGRQTTSVVVPGRTPSPRASPVVGRWTPQSMDTYSSEVTATVQSRPSSPRPLVFDIEVGRRLSDDTEPLVHRLTAMPRPDTPTNVWYLVMNSVFLLIISIRS